MEPLASAVVRIGADDTPLKENLAGLAALCHEIGDCIDRYCGTDRATQQYERLVADLEAEGFMVPTTLRRSLTAVPTEVAEDK